MDRLKQDLIAAWRHLRHGRTTVIMAILVMAVGIGANAAVFSLLNATRLPFPDLDRIVVIKMAPPNGHEAVPALAVPEYLSLQQQNQAFASIGAMLPWPYNVGATRDGEPAERLTGSRYTDTLFTVLGLQPQLGRGFTAEENRLNAPAGSAIISDRFWRNSFGADPSIVGRTVRIDDVPTTVVGVMPAGFNFFGDGQTLDIWTPLPWVSQQMNGTLRFVTVMARLKPGTSMEQAQANLDAVAADLGRRRPAANGGWRMTMEPLNDVYFGATRRRLFILQAAAALILLIACANVAGLLLIRASARHQEIATRYALGADRRRLISQFLTESTFVSLAGGLLGLAFAWAALGLLDGAGIIWLSRLPELRLDPPGIAFTLAISMATGIVFGLAPALQSSRTSLAGLMRSGRGVDTASGHMVRSALIVGQVAIALVLLIGAGLLVRNFIRLQSADLGARPQGVLAFETRLPQDRYQRRVGNFRQFTLLEVSPVPPQIFERLWRRLQEVPGVESIAGINLTPIGGAPSVPFLIEGRAPLVSSDRNPESGGDRAQHYMVTPSYFRTMQIPLRQGRDVSADDRGDAPWVAVINEAAARKYWPGQNPIGRHILFELTADEQPREIVGIAGDVTFNLEERVAEPMVYTARLQQPAHMLTTFGQRVTMTWVARLTAPAGSVLPQLRRAVSEVDPQLPMAQAQSLDQGLALQIQEPQFYMWFIAGFGGIALLMATLGLYGVISYSVSQRGREIALRMALGAQAGDIASLVMRQAVLLGGIGLAAGIGAALLLTRYLQAVLWEITPTDATTFTGVGILLAAVIAGAAAIPTVRALRTNPRTALSEV